MLNTTTADAYDYGFDFRSVYVKHNATASFDEYNSKSADSTSFREHTSRAEDMAEDLREATQLMMTSAEGGSDGMTAAEIMELYAKKGIHSPVPKVHSSVRDLEDCLAVERLLDQALERATFAVSRGIIWGATQEECIWKPLQTETQISNFLHGLGIRRYGNTIRWFAHRISGDPSYRVPGFFEAANLWGKVAFTDGLLDIRSSTFSRRTMSDKVTAVLQYSYVDLDDAPHLDRFTEVMKSLAVTDDCYLRLQEICGLALHAEPSGQILYFQHHNPRVASIFTKLLSKVWSEDGVTFLGLRDHERSFRTAQVLEHPVVISGKEGENMLRDISTILALVDGDGINTDRKNTDPFDFVSRCSLICAGRNLPTLQKSSQEALRYYLVRVNLTGDLPEYISVHDLLHYPREFLIWSLEGLQRYIQNGGRFTFDPGSDIPREDACIVDFVEETILADPNEKIPASVLHEAYTRFCSQRNLPVLSKQRLISYLRDAFHIESRTVRVPWYNEGRPVFGYVGICFTSEYLALLKETDNDESTSDIHQQTVDDEEDDYMTDPEDWAPDFEPCQELVF